MIFLLTDFPATYRILRCKKDIKKFKFKFIFAVAFSAAPRFSNGTTIRFLVLRPSCGYCACDGITCTHAHAVVLGTKELSSGSCAGTKQRQAARALAAWSIGPSPAFVFRAGRKRRKGSAPLPPDGCAAVTRAIGRCRAFTLSRGRCTLGAQRVSAALDLRAKCTHTDAAAAADAPGHVFGLARTWSI